ncbi:MAG: carboxypeptidase-like regulatory domain-containing protein [Bacteroidetes bacterium]|nr:carboxypeptidase-like regulatory domain-containing protein [Bacteroidota bacterium]
MKEVGCRKYKLSKIFISIAVLISLQSHLIGQVIIQGIVKDQKSGQPISFANIYIPEKRMGTATNLYGEFKFELSPIDSMLISAIGYESRLIYLNDSVYNESIEINIDLVPRIYDLTEVVIRPFPTYERFKHEILNYEMTPEEINAKALQEAFRRNLAMLSQNTKPIDYLDDRGGISLGSPVTAIYKLFSRDAKNEKKYNKLLIADKIRLKVGERLNFEVVGKLTGLKDEKEVNDFIAYCNLTDAFVLACTDIQLYNRIMECFQEYTLKE